MPMTGPFRAVVLVYADVLGVDERDACHRLAQAVHGAVSQLPGVVDVVSLAEATQNPGYLVARPSARLPHEPTDGCACGPGEGCALCDPEGAAELAGWPDDDDDQADDEAGPAGGED